MKRIAALILTFSSLTASAALDAVDFATLDALNAAPDHNSTSAETDFDAQPGSYLYSKSSCSAYTACTDYYGNVIGQISCNVYGYQYMASHGLPYAGTNSCMWRTIPYTAVQCTGYQQVWDPYNRRWIWAWQNASFRCPGR